MPTSLRVLFRLPLFLILLLAIAATLMVPGHQGLLALADSTGSETEAPTEYVTTVDPTGPDEGGLSFLYTGDGMAEPERRDFPVQPEVAPDLPFTVTDTIAVNNDPNAPAVLGYIWHIRNAKVDTDNSNVVFSFGGYAITNQPYLDIKVKGDEAGKFKLDATMYTIEPGDLASDYELKVKQAKKGKTEVVIGAQTNPVAPGDLGYVQLNATPSVIAIGESATLSARLLTPDLAPDNSDDVPITVQTPEARPTGFSVNGSATFPPSYTPPAAGLYPLGANAPDYTPADPNTLAVVEVSDLVADRGTIVEPNDPNDPDDIPCCYVEIDPAQPFVTVTAVPNIPLDDSKLPASWQLKHGESGPSVPHAGSHPEDTRTRLTLDALTPGQHLVVAKCGTSERKMYVCIQEPEIDTENCEVWIRYDVYIEFYKGVDVETGEEIDWTIERAVAIVEKVEASIEALFDRPEFKIYADEECDCACDSFTIRTDITVYAAMYRVDDEGGFPNLLEGIVPDLEDHTEADISIRYYADNGIPSDVAHFRPGLFEYIRLYESSAGVGDTTIRYPEEVQEDGSIIIDLTAEGEEVPAQNVIAHEFGHFIGLHHPGRLLMILSPTTMKSTTIMVWTFMDALLEKTT